MRPVPSATIPAPASPATMPPSSHRLRPGTARVAAATMPMISAASRTSRKTMTAVANTRLLRLFGDDDALGGLFVVLADERIAPGFQGTDEDRRRRFAGDDLLAIEGMAFEFLG